MNERPPTSWAIDSSDDESTARLIDEDRKRGSYQSLQRKAIEDHEAGLDKLGEAIKRQKYVANEMATEVDLHNEILDDIDRGFNRADENLRKNTRNIKLVFRKASTFYLWFLIVILAIVIVALTII